MAKHKIFVIALLVTLGSTICMAQDVKNVFEPETELTWLGLDFTGAKFIGDRERLGSTSDVQRLMESWNDIIIKEKDKYSIAAATDRAKDKVQSNIDAVKEHNANLDVTEMFSNNEKDHFHLKPDDIAAILSDYDFKTSGGLGVVFNVESFNKLNEEASIWVTFVDLGAREILFTERVVGKPGGFGMRNFWAGAVYDVMTKMKKKEFEMWRKKYYRK